MLEQNTTPAGKYLIESIPYYRLSLFLFPFQIRFDLYRSHLTTFSSSQGTNPTDRGSPTASDNFDNEAHIRIRKQLLNHLSIISSFPIRFLLATRQLRPPAPLLFKAASAYID